MQRYCPDCRIHNDSIQCRNCRLFLSADPAEVDYWLDDAPMPEEPLRWGTAWAHWGDTIACLSHARRILDRTGQDTCNILYNGPDGSIVEFLRAQPWIERVERGNLTDDYLTAYAMACNECHPPRAWLPYVRTAAFPPDEDVFPTHPTFHPEHMVRCRPLQGLTLPAARVAWADNLWNERIAPLARGRVFMVHPCSVWSESARNHWPHWKQAIEWLLANTPYLYILTGLQQGFAVDHPRLIDLVGKTPTTMEVFALAERCDGVISTCNCLSLYTVAQGIPGLICGNQVMDNASYYFRRYVDRAPNAWLNVDAPFSEFAGLVAGWTPAPQVYAEILRKRDQARESAREPRAPAASTRVPCLTPS